MVVEFCEEEVYGEEFVGGAGRETGGWEDWLAWIGKESFKGDTMENSGSREGLAWATTTTCGTRVAESIGLLV